MPASPRLASGMLRNRNVVGRWTTGSYGGAICYSMPPLRARPVAGAPCIQEV